MDLNASRLAIQAMSLKQSNPDVFINHIGSVQIKGDKTDDPHSIYIRSMLNVVPQLAKIYSHEVLQKESVEAIEREQEKRGNL